MLVELELPHIYHTVARNSPKRKEMEDKWGVFQVNLALHQAQGQRP